MKKQPTTEAPSIGKRNDYDLDKYLEEWYVERRLILYDMTDDSLIKQAESRGYVRLNRFYRATFHK